MRNMIFMLSAFLVMMSACGVVCAFDFDQNASGGVKVTMKSVPFFDDDDKEDSGRSSACDESYDPEDADYKVDIVGRKVPVRTKKGGTAIETR